MAPTRTRRTAAVVLAAGRGTRLRSATPKVLQPVAGRPLLWHAMRNALAARPERLVVVVSPGADDVVDAVRSWGLRPAPTFVVQERPLGTGHAVLAARRAVGAVDEVLVVGGDFDPVTPDDVRALLRLHRRTDSAASILTSEVREPKGYARIVRDGTRLLRIVEGSDAPPELRASREVGALVYAFSRRRLFDALPDVGRRNRQREHYLNDVFPMFIDRGLRVSALRVDTGGLMGANSRAEVAAVAALVRDRINATHMEAGVAILDPTQTWIDVDVRIGPDTVLLPMTFLEGDTRIGAGCTVGPSTRISDSRVADGARVEFSVVAGATLGRDVRVGPYARLRPGAVLDEGAYAGGFVEIKASRIGPGAKVPHLAYVGDATVGARSNIGAGAVTVNYDGRRKNRTTIGDDVRIGSDTMLVAPIDVGDGAVTGAGSVLTRDVPAGALAIERGEQRVVEGYRRRADGRKRDRAPDRSTGGSSGRSKGKGR